MDTSLLSPTIPPHVLQRYHHILQLLRAGERLEAETNRLWDAAAVALSLLTPQAQFTRLAEILKAIRSACTYQELSLPAATTASAQVRHVPLILPPGRTPIHLPARMPAGLLTAPRIAGLLPARVPDSSPDIRVTLEGGCEAQVVRLPAALCPELTHLL